MHTHTHLYSHTFTHIDLLEGSKRGLNLLTVFHAIAISCPVMKDMGRCCKSGWRCSNVCPDVGDQPGGRRTQWTRSWIPPGTFCATWTPTTLLNPTAKNWLTSSCLLTSTLGGKSMVRVCVCVCCRHACVRERERDLFFHWMCVEK